MFLGQYRHSIDNKGRLTVPARYRELLVADGAFVMQGFDCNLMVLTQPAFERVSRKVNQMSMTEPNARMLKRLIFSTAERVEVDKAGRILIPEFLRNGIELVAEAFLIGAGDYFEIWNPKDWEGQNTQLHDLEANSQRFSIWDLSTE